MEKAAKVSSSIKVEEKASFSTLIRIKEVEVEKEASSSGIEAKKKASFLTLIRVGEVGLEKEASLLD